MLLPDIGFFRAAIGIPGKRKTFMNANFAVFVKSNKKQWNDRSADEMPNDKRERSKFRLGPGSPMMAWPHQDSQNALPGTCCSRRKKIPLTTALACVANAIFITDEVGRIVWVNDACCRLTGYSADEIIGYTPAIFKSGRQSASFYADMWQTILAGKIWRGTLIERRKDNLLFTVDETITPLLDNNNIITHFITIQHDVTLRSQEDEQNRYLAFHDILTGLPNRALFLKIQQQAMSHAKLAHRMLALLFLDLDGFKKINDTFGHCIGDQLLVAAGERIRATIRKVDVVSRFGGDEFALLLTDLLDRDVAITLARKLLDSLAQPFVLGDQRIPIHTHASIGIATYPIDDDPEMMLAHADKAMYEAKGKGGNDCVFYEPPSS